MSKIDKKYLDCKKCNNGKVQVSAVLKDEGVHVVINKCENCEYQYDLKEVFSDNGIEMKLDSQTTENKNTNQ